MIEGAFSLTQKAIVDLRSIRYWYEQQQEGLGSEFFKEVAAVLNRAQKNPLIFTFINQNVRRCKPRKFPHYIYFSHKNGIVVLRVRHIKQKPLKRFT